MAQKPVFLSLLPLLVLFLATIQLSEQLELSQSQTLISILKSKKNGKARIFGSVTASVGSITKA